jgi:hypothetical protein
MVKRHRVIMPTQAPQRYWDFPKSDKIILIRHMEVPLEAPPKISIGLQACFARCAGSQ